MKAADEKLLKDTICNICRRELKKEEIEQKLKNEQTDLIESLGFDSFLMVELVVELEAAFDMEFDVNDMDMEELKIYGGLKAAVEKRLDGDV